MSGSSKVHEAIVALWISSGLDELFRDRWTTEDRTQYATLNDAEAAPGTPFPYVTFESDAPGTPTRMSGKEQRKHYISDQTWTFNIWAQGDGEHSAKEQAVQLAGEIMKVFGGHPEESPQTDDMKSKSIVQVQYQHDHGERESNSVYRWTIEYSFKTDRAVMV